MVDELLRDARQIGGLFYLERVNIKANVNDIAIIRANVLLQNSLLFIDSPLPRKLGSNSKVRTKIHITSKNINNCFAVCSENLKKTAQAYCSALKNFLLRSDIILENI